MWRLLPIILLASCAATGPENTASDPNTSTNQRTVNVVEIPLAAFSGSKVDADSSRGFSRGDTQGTIRGNGSWELRRPVTHTRLRCATYETGIQLGRGTPACSQVEWLTDVTYGSNRKHCNNATLIHNGNGRFENPDNTFERANCVRVVTRCTGPC